MNSKENKSKNEQVNGCNCFKKSPARGWFFHALQWSLISIFSQLLSSASNKPHCSGRYTNFLSLLLCFWTSQRPDLQPFLQMLIWLWHSWKWHHARLAISQKKALKRPATWGHNGNSPKALPNSFLKGLLLRLSRCFCSSSVHKLGGRPNKIS